MGERFVLYVDFLKFFLSLHQHSPSCPLLWTQHGKSKTTVTVSLSSIVQGGFFLMKNPLSNGGFETHLLWFCCRLEPAMYEEFHVTDRWTGEDLRCRWTGNIVAIATRHADAVDIRYEVNKRPVWIAMPCMAWVEQKKRTGNVITDALAAQIAGRYLKQAIESGYDNGREMYTMSIEEVLSHLDAVLHEAGHTSKLPRLVPTDDAQPQP
jgi:hypothetical protein